MKLKRIPYPKGQTILLYRWQGMGKSKTNSKRHTVKGEQISYRYELSPWVSHPDFSCSLFVHFKQATGGKKKIKGR